MSKHPTPNEPPKRTAAQFLREKREQYERTQAWLIACASAIDYDWGADIYTLDCQGLPPAVQVVDDFTGRLRARCATSFFPLFRLRSHLDHLLETEE